MFIELPPPSFVRSNFGVLRSTWANKRHVPERIVRLEEYEKRFQAGESVKDAPVLRAVRKSLTDSPVCSTTVVEGEADHTRANSAGVRYARLLCGRCWL
jgi:hypothetical protein